MKTLNTPNYKKSNNLHKRLTYKEFTSDLKNMFRLSKDKSLKENVPKRMISTKPDGNKKIKLNLNRIFSLD